MNPKNNQFFQIETAPTQGSYLIEANAGTGKTYSLTSLYIKFLFHGHRPQEIVAVTFSEMAAFEIGLRIKEVLESILYQIALKNSTKSKNSDPRLRYFLDLFEQQSSKQKEQTLKNLYQAVFYFNQNQLKTIHAFFKNLLTDFSFEVGDLEMELVTSEKKYVRRAFENIIKKYWTNDKLTESTLEKNIKDILEKYPDFFEMFAREIKFFPTINSFGPVGTSLYQQVENFCTRINLQPYPELDNELIQKGSDAHPYLVFYHQLIDEVKKEFERLKKEEKVFDFSDLIVKIGEAIHTKPELLQQVVGHYRVFLIDEFQDTDPVQYDIFHKLVKFQQANKNINQAIYFIGDPKQSIYEFRNANIYTYFKAKNQIGEKNTFYLTDNYRTGKKLINQINQLYLNNNPFADKQLVFDQERHSHSKAPLSNVSGLKTLPSELSVYYPEKSINADDVIKTATETVLKQLIKAPESLGQTAILVDTNTRGTKIKNQLNQLSIPASIISSELLLNTTAAADMILLLRAILSPTSNYLCSVFITTPFGQQIISSNETTLNKLALNFKDHLELWRRHGIAFMLHRITQQYEIDKNYILFAEDITPSWRGHTNWQHLIDLLSEWEISENLTPEFVFQKLLTARNDASEDIKLRDEGFDQAVKILTVHKSKGLEFPITYILNYQKKHDKNKFDIFHDPKKEDDLFFQILQFPDELKNRLKLDFKNEKKLTHERMFCEQLRLFYVALTRGKKQVNLFLSKPIKTAEKNSDHMPFNYLIESQENFIRLAAENGICATSYEKIEDSDLVKTFIQQTPSKLPHNLKLNKPSKPIIVAHYLESFTSLSKTLHFNEISVEPPIELTETANHYIKLGDDIADQHLLEYPLENIETSDEIGDVFKFPGGVESGLFFHDLLEIWSFSTNQENLQNTTTELLKSYPSLKSHQNTIFKIMDRLRTLELFNDFTLNEEIIKNHTLKEMDFYFPLGLDDKKNTGESVSKTKNQFLKDLTKFVKKYPGRFPKINNITNSTPLSESPMFQSGFILGFIDMIVEHNNKYYIIDWKTNYLGDQPEDYQAENLEHAMKNNFYHLQALIYQHALDQWLRFKLKENYQYEKNFGGVAYIFLRGLKMPGQGVYYYSPDSAEYSDFKKLFL